MAQSSAAPNRVYQDFEPFYEWNEDQATATLTVMLPGFRREQLKVQVTSKPVLRINGEREVTQNVWRRFAKEFNIPSYCDTNEVTAKFERGMLNVKFPKIQGSPPKPQEQANAITSAPEEPKTKLESSQPQPQPQPTQEARLEPPMITKQEDDQQKLSKNENEFETKPKFRPQKFEPEPRASTPEVDEQNLSKSEKKSIIKEEKEKSKESTPSNNNQVVGDNDGDKKVKFKGLSNKEESSLLAPRVNEKQGAKMVQRLKTRVLDFTLSLRSSSDDDRNKDVDQCLVKGIIKKPKILMNIIVAILLVMVLGIYVKNAFKSSSSSQGEANFHQEF
ncbi:inactive protein RESTRICTED TEV MOVEMENT 2-like [Arachis duranensis]|uniref:Inactive protein RESTRICTED TEV MOVEMENT 2-like n=1 Tax=Arachis duranensis TaxID=130453 RepID=A0A6P4E4Q7_ARADU|nr:inactive protein RESTRICTED TEV MOVEMENT 2-like [Arachis duranensis]